MKYKEILFTVDNSEGGINIHFNDNLIIKVKDVRELDNIIKQLGEIKDELYRCYIR